MNTRLLIGGRLVAGEGAADVVLDAATAAQIASVQAASVEQVQAAVAAAEKAFDGWSRTAPKERALALTRIAEEIEADADGYAALESRNTGKPLAAASFSVVSGVISEGLRTSVLPAAMAGAIFQAAIIRG